MASTLTSYRFVPGIAIMEASVVFVPCWQILKGRKLQRETLEILAEWENKHQSGASIGSDSTKAPHGHVHLTKSISTRSTGSRRGEMYTMNALEKALQTNSRPLLVFASLKDFSGENICFLNHIRDWKAAWYPPIYRFALSSKPSTRKIDGEALQRQQFNSAVQIFASFVSEKYSKFPLNLSSHQRKSMEAVFENAASLISTHIQDNSATPFDFQWDLRRSDDGESGPEKDGISVTSTCLNNSSDEITAPTGRDRLSGTMGIPLVNMEQHLPADVTVPETFGPEIFDEAVESVKYMVLTNTWPKFVAAGYANSLEQTSVLNRMRRRTSALVGHYSGRWTRRGGM